MRLNIDAMEAATTIQTLHTILNSRYAGLLMFISTLLFCGYVIIQLNTLNARVGRMENVDLPEIRQDMVDIKIRLTKIEVRLDHIEEDITEMKTDIREMKADISEMKADISEMKADIKTLLSGKG